MIRLIAYAIGNNYIVPFDYLDDFKNKNEEIFEYMSIKQLPKIMNITKNGTLYPFKDKTINKDSHLENNSAGKKSQIKY